MFSFLFFFISFVRFSCNWQPVGLWRPFTSVLPAFQSGIKYYVFLLVFSSAISLCFVDSSLLSLLLFGRIPFRSFVRRYGLRAKHSGFRFFLLCPSVSDFGQPTTVKYSPYHVLSLLLVCSPFPSYTLLVNCIPTSLPCLDSSGLVF